MMGCAPYHGFVYDHVLQELEKQHSHRLLKAPETKALKIKALEKPWILLARNVRKIKSF